MSAVPARILVLSLDDSKSVQVLQFSSRLSRWRLCIFHFPTRKSKSLGDEVADALMMRSPLASKVTFGIGMDSSAVRALLSALSPETVENKSRAISFFIDMLKSLEFLI